MGWRNDIRLELMREASLVCRRCGGPLDERDSFDQAVCSDCQYNDWHEDYPDLESQEGDE